MTDYIKLMRDNLRAKRHHVHRRQPDFPDAGRFAGVPHMERVTQALCDMLAAERPVVLPEEKILFWRTVPAPPEILTPAEWSELRAGHFLHEQGRVCNISPNYSRIIAGGLDAESARIDKRLASCEDEEAARFYRCAQRSISALLDLVDRYREAALAAGNLAAAQVLAQVPRRGARTFREALQSLRILQYALWSEGEYHNTLGRFDLYMGPYLLRDLEEGRLTDDEAFELVEDFFLALNRDSDLYPGIQQGDNGQSIMLGGVDREGRPVYNRLSEMCLEACRELKLIDPKINLRVGGDTPLSVYETGSLLTKEGLGFPQYSNDDVVIDGLTRLGYDLADARDYTVAACWEFIIPGVGMDIPNIAAVNFPGIVNDCVREDLAGAADFEAFYRAFARRLADDCRRQNEAIRDLYMLPAPLLSVYMDGCLERGRDISLGAKYNNFGYHGVGIATAVDSLSAVKKCVYEEGTLTVERAVDIVTNGFDGDTELLTYLRGSLPHMGNDDDEVDSIAVRLMSTFAEAVRPLRNERGGCVRAGTGSAMYYLWCAADIGSTLSGHMKGEAFSANYSPELFLRNRGPLSVIRSFTKPNLVETINGGPLTMEFHSTIFRDPASIRKVALLVKAFIESGGHQLQLNSVNLDMLLDAQTRPEEHRNLIVRIWGWSAYFVELDREYQNHVISRQTFVV